MICFLNKVDAVDDLELLELVGMELRRDDHMVFFWFVGSQTICLLPSPLVLIFTLICYFNISSIQFMVVGRTSQLLQVPWG